MKKTLLLTSLVLVLGLIVSCLLIFGTSASEPSYEATLTTTKNYGTDTATVSTKSGSLDELTAEIMAGLSPEVSTEYKLTLLGDATGLGVLSNLDGNGNARIYVDLAGYTVSSLATAPLFKVGNIADLTVDGGFTDDLHLGSIVEVGGATRLVELSEGSVANVTLRNLDLYSKDGNDIGRYISVLGGSLRLINSNVSLIGSYACEAIYVKDARLILSNTSVSMTKSAKDNISPILNDGGVLRIENSGVSSTDNCISLTGEAYMLAISSTLHAGEYAVTTPYAEPKATVHLGGATVYAKRVASKDDVVTAWYATGSTYIETTAGTDGVKVGGTKASFAALGNGYTLATSSTEAALTTTFAERATPTEKYDSFSGSFGVFSKAEPTTPTVYSFAMLADWTNSGKAATITGSNRNVTLFFDLNGHNIKKEERHSVNFNGAGYQNVYFDGADVNGNKGAFINTAGGQFIYGKDGASDTFLSFTNIDFTYTDNISSKAPVLQLQGGSIYVENSSFNYTGADIPDGSSAFSFYSVYAQDVAKIHIKDSSITSVYDKVGYMKGVSAGGANARIYLDNVVIDAPLPVNVSTYTTYDTEVIVYGSKITTNGVAYNGGTSKNGIKVVDTETTITGSEVASSYACFMVGKGMNIVKTNASSISGGCFEKEGYGFYPTEDGTAFTVSYGTLSLPEIYRSGMVLQGRKEMSIIGYCATEGARIVATVGDYRSSVGTVTDGTFKVTFEGLPYMKGTTLRIEEVDSSAQPLIISDVDVGEVWLMSGQSNSVYDITDIEDFEEYLYNADNFNNIKAYIVPQSSGMQERDVTESAWHTVDKAYLNKLAGYGKASLNKFGLSGIAYVMATRLATEIPDATIAIIDANFNGSCVQGWSSYEMLKEYAPSYAETYKAYLDFYTANGRYPDSSENPTDATYITSDKLYQKMGTACYNAMIAPMEGFSIAGAVWYQGEGNGGDVTETSDAGYYDRFRAVRASFREAFNDEELPTFIVQIPPYFSRLLDFKNLQYRMAKEDKDTYVVASTVVGPVFSNEDFHTSSLSDSMVHFARKSPIGIAVAAEILENIYKAADGKAAPKVVSTTVSASKITLVFDRPIDILWGEEITGFELAGSDGRFKSAIATVIDDKTIELFAPGIAAPKSVRYGYGIAVFEMEDGTILPLDKDVYSYSATETGVSGEYLVKFSLKATGEVLYEFLSSDPYIIRTRSTGNVAGESGQCLPNFRIDI